jgi:anti-sigma factor RsiW
MECEKIMELFLELDNGEELPAEVAEHLAACPRCAAQAAAFVRFMNSCAAYADFSPHRDIAAGVMACIERAVAEDSREETIPPLSMVNWIGGGLFLFAGMLLIPFSGMLQELIRNLPGLGIALPVALGLIIAVYAALFTGSHMDALSRFLRLR